MTAAERTEAARKRFEEIERLRAQQWTMKRIGQLYGCSKQRIGQIIERQKLRAA